MTFAVEGVSTSGHGVYRIGTAETLDEAIQVAQTAIQDFLIREFRKGTTAEQLYAIYLDAGVVPCIFRDDNETIVVRNFNHMQYANECCAKICGALSAGESHVESSGGPPGPSA